MEAESESDLWVIRIGPIPLVDGPPWSVFVGVRGTAFLGPYGERDEDGALEHFARLAEGARRRCDRSLAGVAAAHGYEAGEVPRRFAKLRAAFAMSYLNGKTKMWEGGEDLVLMGDLIVSGQMLWDAAHEQDWPVLKIRQVRAEGAVEGEFIAAVEAEIPEYTILSIADVAILDGTAEILTASGQFPRDLLGPDYRLILAEDPPFAREILAAIDKSAIPRIFGPERRSGMVTFEETLLIAATAQVMASDSHRRIELLGTEVIVSFSPKPEQT